MTDIHEKIRSESMTQFGLGPESMKKIKVCRHCRAKVSSELMFCPECEMPLPAETLYMKYVHNHFVCTKCETVVCSDYNYCPRCGKQLIFDKKAN